MKKTSIIVLINLAALFLIFILVEYCIYDKSDKAYPFFIMASDLDHLPMDKKYEQLKKEDYFTDGISQEEFKFRRPVGLNYKNKPIILFGGSFGWGAGLQEKQTFHYKLSELTKRPVYNRSVSGWGVQHMLYQLRRDDFYNEVPKPEYVIYVYISDHISRMYKYSFIKRLNFNDGYQFNYLKYNEKNGALEEEKRIKNIPYSRLYNWYFLEYRAEKNAKNSKKAFDMLEKHLLECRKQIDKHWGRDVKFIVLNYEYGSLRNPKGDSGVLIDFSEMNEGVKIGKQILNEDNIKKLSKEGIEVISAMQLTKKELGDIEYQLGKNNYHPNEKAWDLITPLFMGQIK